MEGQPFVSEKERWRLGRMAAERLKASGCDRSPAVLLVPKDLEGLWDFQIANWCCRYLLRSYEQFLSSKDHGWIHLLGSSPVYSDSATS